MNVKEGTTVWMQFPRLTGPWYAGIVKHRTCMWSVAILVIDEIPHLGKNTTGARSEMELKPRDPKLNGTDKP